MLDKQDKKEVIGSFGNKYGRSAQDSGSAAVQVALLTKRINGLRPHFDRHKSDHHGKRGLMKLIGRRRTLLRYMQRHQRDKYQELIKELGLRK